MKILLLIFAVKLLALAGALAQQASDTEFSAKVPAPAYAHALGPRVMIDEAHHNFHTADGRYAAFADLLRKDGYRVMPSRMGFAKERMKKADILVIANALH
jgi:hypothetical protein